MLHLPLVGLAASAVAGTAVALTVTVAAVPQIVNDQSAPSGPIAVYGNR
jgi:hypothetical protein